MSGPTHRPRQVSGRWPGTANHLQGPKSGGRSCKYLAICLRLTLSTFECVAGVLTLLGHIYCHEAIKLQGIRNLVWDGRAGHSAWSQLCTSLSIGLWTQQWRYLAMWFLGNHFEDLGCLINRNIAFPKGPSTTSSADRSVPGGNRPRSPGEVSNHTCLFLVE